MLYSECMFTAKIKLKNIIKNISIIIIFIKLSLWAKKWCYNGGNEH